MQMDTSYKLTIVQEPDYLHAIVTGVNNKTNVKRYLEEILHECMHRDCHRLLIEERLDGPRIGTIDVFQVASEGSTRALGHFEAIAYVDINAAGNLMKFAENVAVNRGLPVKVFSSVSAAKLWLQDKDRGPAE
jgi:hypothetical protein